MQHGAGIVGGDGQGMRNHARGPDKELMTKADALERQVEKLQKDLEKEGKRSAVLERGKANVERELQTFKECGKVIIDS